MLDKIKSKYIIEEIFKIIGNKRKLKIIKFNKEIKKRLDIDIEEFKPYPILKEFNQKYKTNIEDIDREELNLEKNYLKKEGFNDLIKIKFKNINLLNIYYNNIKDINTLEEANFKGLKILNLGRNNISDISVLSKVNFKELRVLDLNDNCISNINVLENVNFKKLVALDFKV